LSTAPAAAASPAALAPSPQRVRARRKAAWRRRRLVLLLMSPWIVGLVVFFGYPLITTVYFSFTHYDLLSSPKWVGFANYDYLFNGDPRIWPAVYNTLWIIVIGVPLQVLFAFAVATMVTRAKAGVGLFRAIFYLPTIAPAVAAVLGFVYLFNPATGPVNTILGHVGINGPLWFQSPSWSKPTLVLLALWGIGNTMIIFLAAILDVPKHLYEAAELDGAGPLRRLRWVTLPTISPVILFAVVIGVIEGLQYFTEAYVASTVAAPGAAGQAADAANNLGYPQDSTLFFPVLLYQQGFRYFNMGYASAMAVLLLVVTLAVTVVILRRSGRFVHYAGGLR
jgi:multiple sugar transport system permease protein